MKTQYYVLTSVLRGGLNTFLACSLVLCAATFAAAQQDEAAQPGGSPSVATQRGARLQRPNLMAALNLSPDQIVRFREIKQRNQPERQRLQRAQRFARVALDEAIYAPDSNEGLIEEKMRALSAAHTALTRFDTDEQLQIKQLLTPEQLSIFRDFRRAAQNRNPNSEQRRNALRERMQQRRANRQGDIPRRNRLRGNAPSSMNANPPPN